MPDITYYLLQRNLEKYKCKELLYSLYYIYDITLFDNTSVLYYTVCTLGNASTVLYYTILHTARKYFSSSNTSVELQSVCVCVCMCVFIKFHITAQFGPVILVILCHSH